MTKKVYRSKAAEKMAQQRGAKPAPRPSKKFTGNDKHNGGSRGQSGQQKRGR